MPTVPVSIHKIKFNSLNRRAVKNEKVEELKESIKLNGLLNPITVDQKLNLIAGLHRLTACQRLGLEEIECNIITYDDDDQARLAEIDENFVRSELDHLERGQLFRERDRILERLGLRAKAGDNQHSRGGGEIISPPQLKTTADLAREQGYSERSMQLEKQIARDIAPKIQAMIEGTPLAKNKTKLLQVARTGSKERILAEQAEKASEQALALEDVEEAEKQAKLAEIWRLKLEELQLQTLKSAIAEREAKSSRKKAQPQVEQPEEKVTEQDSVVEIGEQSILGRHLVYCGDTSSQQFINRIPENAALAIATVSPTWNHNYLVDKARVVAVIRAEGNIYEFYSRQQMPFQQELVLGNLYVGIFSHQSISKPQTPSHIEGVEAIVNYLLHLYTNPHDSVIAPFMGYGEILMTCERMGRTCFIGDDNSARVNYGITRWQKQAGKLIEKIETSSKN